MRRYAATFVDGREVQGSLTRSEKPGMVVINTIVESEETSLDSIANLLYYGKTLKSRFTGNVSSGFAYTKSSQIGRLNVDGNINTHSQEAVTILINCISMSLTGNSIKLRSAVAFGIGHSAFLSYPLIVSVSVLPRRNERRLAQRTS